MKKWVKISLFLNSYLPLFIMIIIKNYLPLSESSKKPCYFIFPIILIMLIIIPIIVLIYLFRVNQTMQPVTIQLDKVVLKNADVLNYIVAYLIPFLGFNFKDWKDILFVSFFLFIIAVIYIKTNLIYVNPVLFLLGYSIYEIQNENQFIFMFITKCDNIRRGQTVKVVELTKNIYLERRS